MPRVITPREMKAKLLDVHSWSKLHVIGVTRVRSEEVLEGGGLLDGSTITFYDDNDVQNGENAYCLGLIRGGRIRITHKAYGTMPEDDD